MLWETNHGVTTLNLTHYYFEGKYGLKLSNNLVFRYTLTACKTFSSFFFSWIFCGFLIFLLFSFPSFGHSVGNIFTETIRSITSEYYTYNHFIYLFIYFIFNTETQIWNGWSTVEYLGGLQQKTNHNTFLENCPPTPPLSQHFVLSEN